MLGIAKGQAVVPIIAPRLSDLIFASSLLTNLRPQKYINDTVTEPGAGSIALVEDHDGILRRTNSGELRFRGARRVENLIAQQNMNTGWNKDGGVTDVYDAATNTNAITDFDAGSGAVFSETIDGSVPVGGQTLCFSFEARATGINANGTWLRVVVRQNTGTASVVSIEVELTTNFKRYQIFSLMASDVVGWRVQYSISTDHVGEDVTNLDIRNLQGEEISGASVQVAGEWVDPAVDYDVGNAVVGVKNFPTANGNTVSSDVVTNVLGSALATLKGYFAEPARDNELPEPLDFSAAAWAKANCTAPRHASQTGPTGRIDIYELTEATDTNEIHEIVDVTDAVAAGATITFSIFVKPNSANTNINLRVSDGGVDNDFFISVDLSDGSLLDSDTDGTGVLLSAFIEALADGWYRVWATGSITGVTTYTCTLRMLGGGGGSTHQYDGTGNSFYIFGAQIEVSTNVSTFYPLNGTRVADFNHKYDESNLDPLLGSFECDYIAPYASDEGMTAAGSIFRLGDANSRVVKQAAGTGAFSSTSAAGTTGTATVGFAYDAGDSIRVRVRWNAVTGDHNISLKDPAGTVVDDATPISAFNTFNIAGSFMEVLQLCGVNDDGSVGIGHSIKNIKIYNADRGDDWLNAA